MDNDRAVWMFDDSDVNSDGDEYRIWNVWIGTEDMADPGKSWKFTDRDDAWDYAAKLADKHDLELVAC